MFAKTSSTTVPFGAEGGWSSPPMRSHCVLSRRSCTDRVHAPWWASDAAEIEATLTLLAWSRPRHHSSDESDKELRRRARAIFAPSRGYPDAHCELDFATPLELLVATVLSAQCTDQRVNKVTPELFRRYPDAAALAGAKREELEQVIAPTGFFREKAQTIQQIGQRLCDDFGGDVPADLDSLVSLPGVGRKTANVVLGNAFDIPGITVDTRTSGRLASIRVDVPEEIRTRSSRTSLRSSRPRTTRCCPTTWCGTAGGYVTRASPPVARALWRPCAQVSVRVQPMPREAEALVRTQGRA